MPDSKPVNAPQGLVCSYWWIYKFCYHKCQGGWVRLKALDLRSSWCPRKDVTRVQINTGGNPSRGTMLIETFITKIS